MTICDGLGLRRAGSFAFEQLVVVSSGSTDLRWALAALVLQSLGVLGANCRVLFNNLARGAARRAASARFPVPVGLGSQLSRTSDRRHSQGPVCPRHRPC
jgi:hypothetical protein